MAELSYDELPGVRRSDLWLMHKTPAHFKFNIEHRPEPTKALLFGIAAHAAILEPRKFQNEYAVAPNVDRRTKAGKEEYAAFLEENAGKNIISREDLDTIVDMEDAFYRNKTAFDLMIGQHEVPVTWTDPDTGELCKAKYDCITLIDGKPYIVDYKTTDSCEDGVFERSARKYGYKFQTGMYTEGYFQNFLEECGFAFVAQEKTAPFLVRTYFCDREFIREGYDQFRLLLGMYHECKENNIWPGYEDADLLAEG